VVVLLLLVVAAARKIQTFGLREPVTILRLPLDLFDLARPEEVTDLQRYRLFDM
jgi:hypothetical protein